MSKLHTASVPEVETNINCVKEAQHDQAPGAESRETVPSGVIAHRKDYFYLAFREEYLFICMKCKYKKSVKNGAKSKASPHCKAFILAILERWTDDKRKKGEDPAIYMTYPQWVEEMYGLFGRNVIIDSLDELLGEGLISREKHKIYGKDSYKYRLNCQELNNRINLLPRVHTFTNKRDKTNNAFTNQRDAFTNKPDSRLQVNDDAFTKGRNIESTIDSANIDSTERTNRERQQKDNVENFPPSTRPSKSSQKFSSEDEKQEEVTLTDPGQHIYDFACKTLFSAKKPKITKKIKDECELLASHVKTFEQFESLLQYVQSKFDAPWHLKNMTNELNDWLQLQNMASNDMQGLEWLPTSHAGPEPEATQETTIETYLPEATENVPQVVEDVKDDDVTDDGLIDKMEGICKYYGQDSYLAVCCNTLADIRDEYRLNNATLYDSMTEACRQIEWNRTPGVQAFFDELYGSLAGAFDRQEQLAGVC